MYLILAASRESVSVYTGSRKWRVYENICLAIFLFSYPLICGVWLLTEAILLLELLHLVNLIC